ncbi:phosphopantetheine-binding protein [Streptomyces bacillaris]|uniref:acyl carrier protein n=1 Tax=Streptomyces TaxID=1883 RepID=UPI00163C2428|nr:MULTISPECIES: phosphopantetheine-binding protein [Streptomyces]MBT3073244.1 acyl carrier protein [Streptomyces sp. COG21]MBT3081646.1 acyl carrier protein [Streptomyces sp. COG20]MBT3085182.1 acyl carrier protein [Streptomyces sp. CYG21]MBT3100436.1 acyl carrier protein [Streptomyces sp. CBG30]MBT3105576.1 acyl carrier protein [Streptomyces sp. COG19]
MSMTYELIVGVLVEKFSVPPDRITPEAVLGDLDLDSLARLEFAETLRESLGAELADDEVVPSTTLAALAVLAEERTA